MEQDKEKRRLKISVIILSVVCIFALGVVILIIHNAGVVTKNAKTAHTFYETVVIEKPESIKVNYYYGDGMQKEGFELDITDKELINELVDSISNKELVNETKAGLMLEIIGNYEFDFGNNIKVEIGDFRSGYVKIHDHGKDFITQINVEPFKKIESIVNAKLTEDAKIFNTDKITITNNENKQVNITRKTALEYFLKECKDIGVKGVYEDTDKKEPNYMVNWNSTDIPEEPKYKINFNNGIEIWQYNESIKNVCIKDEIKYRVYGVEALYKILEFAFYDSEEKNKMFSTDKIIIESPSKVVEVTDKDIIEKLTTPIVYSDLQERDYISERDITEEYNNAIKIKINDYEVLVSDKGGEVRMGDRYIIYPDKTRKMYFLLEDIEDYANELLYGSSILT